MVNTQPQCTERLPCILLQNNLPVSLTGRSSYSPNRTYEPEQFAVTFVSSPPSSQKLCVQFWPLTDARESTPIDSDSNVRILYIFAQIHVATLLFRGARCWVGLAIITGRYAVYIRGNVGKNAKMAEEILAQAADLITSYIAQSPSQCIPVQFKLSKSLQQGDLYVPRGVGLVVKEVVKESVSASIKPDAVGSV